MFLFVDFNLFLFSRLTNVTKVLVFMQKMAIFFRLRKVWKSVVNGRKKMEKGGENSREVGEVLKGFFKR